MGSHEDGLRHRMGAAHERDLAVLLGGRQTRGSGNQFADQMDGRHDPYDDLALAWDCKSTRSNSVGVSKRMWEKALEQAHGARPILPIRFYGSDRLDIELDLVVASLNDFVEILDRARRP